ncbi:MAG: hypothetical protein E6P95_02240 [Candidatus Moraniibacteriota bacterium]|nr:MAG: hypothetical protein E6P95_02240 [Candidatus Moranbacteria bacterium]
MAENKKTPTKKVTSKKVKQPEVKPVAKKPVASNQGHEANRLLGGILLPQRVVVQIAEEVAQRVTSRLRRPVVDKPANQKLLENPLFLDTSAIIDARVFELIRIGVFTGTFVVVEGVLDELKHIADSKDTAKKERGRKGLTLLEKLRKDKSIKFDTYDDSDIKKPVDERIIEAAKITKGKIITCDFNLSKKAQISNVVAIDMYEMANVLKTTALPGEEFFIKVVQKGKGDRQGVGYLPDGTMVVVEEGEDLLEQTVKVLISRVIQTDVGRIFFGKIVV